MAKLEGLNCKAFPLVITLSAKVPRNLWIGRPHRGVHRKLLVPDHPYGFFYVVEPSRVVIVAVLDLRQDPKAIERRLRS